MGVKPDHNGKRWIMLNILQGTKAKKLTSISKLRINQIAGQWSLKWFGSHFGQISSCDITPGGVKFSKNTKIHDGLTYKALRRRFYRVITCRWCWKMNISNWTPLLKLKNGTCDYPIPLVVCWIYFRKYCYGAWHEIMNEMLSVFHWRDVILK